MKRVLLRITPGIEAGRAREDHDRPPGLEVRRAAGGGGGDPRAGAAARARVPRTARPPRLAAARRGARSRRAVEQLAAVPRRARLDAGDPRPRRRARHPVRRWTSRAAEESACGLLERAARAAWPSRSPAPQRRLRAGPVAGRPRRRHAVPGRRRSSARATTWVAVDGGMSDNPRPALYGARYSALLANRAASRRAGTYAVCGKHCESGDVLIERPSCRTPPRRPARSAGDRRVRARDGVELQRAPRAARRPRRQRGTRGKARALLAKVIGFGSTSAYPATSHVQSKKVAPRSLVRRTRPPSDYQHHRPRLPAMTSG